MTATTVIVVIASLIATALANLRWWRVAQREHYLTGSVSRFVARWWWGSTPVNRVLIAVAAVGAVFGLAFRPAILLIAIVAALGPWGLGLKGRTSRLTFTRRMKTLAVATVVIEALVIFIGWTLGDIAFAAGLVAIAAPTLIDVADAALVPWEKKQAKPFVTAATKRLREVNPKVVAITGSYGKTTTKNYINHLLRSRYTVLATPSSFNNRAGLSRSINEQLTPGTDVFIAEMGTYGPGEIAELCAFIPPTISILTSIGPVHLERFGSEEAIIKAKSEIFDHAETCVLNVDDYRLAEVANELEAEGKRVWRCATAGDTADVIVRDAIVMANGEVIFAGSNNFALPMNVACAVAVALDLEVSREAIKDLLASLPQVAHRQETSTADSGVVIIDDTYNANPASVRSALDALSRNADQSHRRVVATPGMVELGNRQSTENFAFARDAGHTASDLIVIGRTNRRALLAGAKESGLNVVVVDHREEAVDWVRKNTNLGDAVAYVNDLPDHFP